MKAAWDHKKQHSHWSNGAANQCWFCHQPRHSRQIEYEAEQVRVRERLAEAKASGAAPADDDARPKRRRLSKKARKAKARTEEEGDPPPSADTVMDSDDEEEKTEADPSPALATLEAAKAKRREWLGLPPPVSDNYSTKLYPVAGQLAATPAEELAGKFLAGQASEALAALQKEVADLHSLAGMCKRTCGEKSAAYVDIALKLETQNTALKKLSKNSPAACSKATEDRLKTARKDVVGAQTARADRARTGAEKAQARFKADQSDLDRAVHVLQLRKAEHAQAFLASQASFAAFDEARRLQDAAVLAIVDAKIEQATPVGGASVAPAGPAPVAPARPEGYADLELQADVPLWSVPVLTEEILAADAPAKEQIERAWAFFSNTPAGSTLPPMTYRQLGLTDMKTLPLIIGEPAMRAFYRLRTIVTACYVPWQVVELVRYSLSQSNKCLSRDATSKEEALERLKTARDAALEHGYQRSPY